MLAFLLAACLVPAAALSAFAEEVLGQSQEQGSQAEDMASEPDASETSDLLEATEKSDAPDTSDTSDTTETPETPEAVETYYTNIPSVDSALLGDPSEYVAGEIIVTLASEADTAAQLEEVVEEINLFALAAEGVNVAPLINGEGITALSVEAATVNLAEGEMLETSSELEAVAVVTIPDELDVAQAIAIAQGTTGVIAAQPNYIYTLENPPVEATAPEITPTSVTVPVNDNFIINGNSWLWHLFRTRTIEAWANQAVQGLADGSITVAVCDTGVDLTHPELIDNLDLVHAWDATADTALVANGNFTGDDYGHGTFIAGIIAAKTGNGVSNAGQLGNAAYSLRDLVGADAANELFLAGFAGMGLNKIKVLPVRMSVDGTATTATELAALGKVIEYRNGAIPSLRTVNWSFGGYTADHALAAAIKAAKDAGILVVAAAGNGTTSQPHYPAALDEVISVSATTFNDSPASFTNYGNAIDLAAPGYGIISTYTPNDGLGFGYYGAYCFYRASSGGGTSYAAPMVAATAALLRGINANLTNDDVKSILYSSAEDLGPAGWDAYYGHGMLNTNAAIAQLTGYTGGGTAEATGSCGAEGDNLNYSYAGGVLTITGSGALASYASAGAAPWYTYRESITTLNLPAALTSIGANAFADLSALTTVNLPSGLTTVGAGAFENCIALASLSLPASVTVIGESAFANCAFTSIEIPQGVVELQSYAFSNCLALTTVALPASATTLGAGVFTSCTALELFTVDANNTSYVAIDGVLYSKDHTKLLQYPTKRSNTSYEIPAGVTTIAKGAFQDADDLSAVSIPTSVTNIESNAFNSAGLGATTIPASVTSMGSYVFAFCPGPLYVEGSNYTPAGWDPSWNGWYHGQVYWNQSAPTGGGGSGGTVNSGYCGGTPGGQNVSWSYDQQTKTLSIAGTGTMASYDTYSPHAPWYDLRAEISSIVIGEGVTSIGYAAFYNCSTLTSVLLPASLTMLSAGSYGSSFGGCTSLVSIDVDAQNPAYSSIDGVLYNKAATELLMCPQGKKGAVSLPLGLTSIAANAFNSCARITTITVPAGVSEIPIMAFSNCSALQTVVLGAGITVIGNSAFFQCIELTSIVLPATVNTLGSGAFAGCKKLTSITLPEALTSIGTYAFEDCSLLTTIIIPAAVNSIGSYGVFYRCTSLTAIEVAANNATYSSESGLLYNKDKTALLACPGAKAGAVTLPASVRELPLSSGFAENTHLTSVSLPEGLTHIPFETFANCTSLASVVIPSTVTGIGDNAFYNCSSLATLLLPDGLTTLEYSCFRGCSALTSISFGAGLSSIIGAYIFDGCLALESINVAEGNTAFSSEDGILFSKDKTRLIAYPPAKTATSYVIPASVTTVPARAFADAKALKRVEIPATVSSLSDAPFFRCASLTSIRFYGQTPSMTPDFYALFGSNASDLGTIYVPAGSEAAYQKFIGSELPYWSIKGVSEQFVFEVTTTGAATNFEIPLANALTETSAGTVTLTTPLNWNINWGDGSAPQTVTNSELSRASSTVTPGMVIGIPHTYATADTYTVTITPAGSEDAWLAAFGFGDTTRTQGAAAQVNRNLITKLISPLTPLMTRSYAQLQGYGSPYSEWHFAFAGCKNLTMGENFTFDATAWAVHQPNPTAPYTSVGLTSAGSYFALGMFLDCSGNSFTMSPAFNLPQGFTSSSAGFAMRMFSGCNGTGFKVNAAFSLPAGLDYRFDWGGEGTLDLYRSFAGITAAQTRTIKTILAGIEADSSVVDEDQFPHTFTGSTGFSDHAYTPAFFGGLGQSGQPDDVVVSLSALSGIVAPAAGVTAAAAITPTAQYTGTVNWTPALVGNAFAPGTVYTATISLTPKAGYTLEGVAADFFTVAGATSVFNAAGSGVVTVVFPAFALAPALTFTRSASYDIPVSTVGTAITSIDVSGGAAGGTAPYAFSATGLPAGITISSEGVISGTPTAARGAGTAFITVTDSATPRPAAAQISISFGATNVVTDDYEFETATGTLTVKTNDGTTSWRSDQNISTSMSPLRTVVLSNSVTAIPGSTALPVGFAYCTSLTSIVIPNSVITIGSSAFAGCSSLSSIVIPSSVTEIGERAFSNCTSLAAIAIPSSVTTIGSNPFSGCTALAAIAVESGNQSFVEQDGVLLNKDQGILVAYPAGKSGLSYAIPSSVTTIGRAAFSDCKSLASVVIPDSVSSIGWEAFAGCTSLSG